MSRAVESPVKRWPGKIWLPDTLNFAQYLAWKQAVQKAEALGEVTIENAAVQPEMSLALLPGLLACVERWELSGTFPATVTVETFPAAPRTASIKLLTAVTLAVNQLVKEQDDDPNE